MEKNKEAITDKILLCLKSKKLTDIQTPDQMRALKHELAEGINGILVEKKAGAPDKKDADKAKTTDAKDEAKDKPPIPEDYDSDTGPVLKIYFTSFATQ